MLTVARSCPASLYFVWAGWQWLCKHGNGKFMIISVGLTPWTPPDTSWHLHGKYCDEIVININQAAQSTQNCLFSLFSLLRWELRERWEAGRITSHLCNLQVLSNYRNVWQYLTICCDQFIIIQSRYFMVTSLIITDWDISADWDPTWSSSASASICYTGLTWGQTGLVIGGGEECDNYSRL